MTSFWTSRAWTYSKVFSAIIVTCCVWAFSDIQGWRPWYWLLRLFFPFIDRLDLRFRITIDVLAAVFFIFLATWALRPHDMKLEYTQQ